MTSIKNICPICCEEKYQKNIVSCPYCTHKACRNCNERYLLESISNPHCMNCRNRWTYNILLSLFTKIFVNKTYREQRGAYLLDRAKSQLPIIMPYIDIDNQIEANLKLICQIIYEINIKSIRNGRTHKIIREIRQLKNEKFRLVQLSKQLYSQSFNWRFHRGLHRGDVGIHEYEEPCPIDNCRGFINKSNQRCVSCFTFVCRACAKAIGKLVNGSENIVNGSENIVNGSEIPVPNQSSHIVNGENIVDDGHIVDDGNIVDGCNTTPVQNQSSHIVDGVNGDDNLKLKQKEKFDFNQLKKTHVCKEDDIASIKEIRKHTRQCPSCKIPIHRISGCDTMWCTRCNTGFNWRTGIIIKNSNQLHNPHYLDFIRNNPTFKYNIEHQGREVTNPCDNVTLQNVSIPDLSRITRYYQRHKGLSSNKLMEIQKYQQEMNHFRDYAINKFIDRNRNESVYVYRYLKNKINEKQWRINIEHLERFRQINLEYVDVTITWLVVMLNLFDKYLFNPLMLNLSEADVDMFLKEMSNITNFTQDLLHQMNHIYKRKTNIIGQRVDPKATGDD